MKAKDWVRKRLPDAEYVESMLETKFAVVSSRFSDLHGGTLTGWIYKDGRREPSAWVIAKKQIQTWMRR